MATISLQSNCKLSLFFFKFFFTNSVNLGKNVSKVWHGKWSNYLLECHVLSKIISFFWLAEAQLWRAPDSFEMNLTEVILFKFLNMIQNAKGNVKLRFMQYNQNLLPLFWEIMESFSQIFILDSTAKQRT